MAFENREYFNCVLLNFIYDSVFLSDNFSNTWVGNFWNNASNLGVP